MRKYLFRFAWVLICIVALINISTGQPTVTINKAATQPDPTSAVPIHFTVVFDQVVTGFDASDISFAGSTTLGTLVATVTGSGSTYDVSVNGMTSEGVVIASVIAGAATNNTGQSSLASTSTDNAVFLLVTPHNLTIQKLGPSTAIAGNNIVYGLLIINNSTSIVLGITVTDLLPAGVTFVSLALPIPTWTAITPTAGQSGTVAINIPVLFPHEQFNIPLTVNINTGQTGSITNTVTISGPPGDVFPPDNVSSLTTQIIVPPNVICPGNIVVNAEPGTCNATVSFTGANAVVVTGTPAPTISYTVNLANGGEVFGTGNFSTLSFPGGVNTITITAANDGGSASCSFTVTVADNQPPVINCPSDITVNAPAGQCSAMVTYEISGFENCMQSQSPLTIQSSDGFTINFYGSIPTFSESRTTSFPVGTTTVNVLATDAFDNIATCSFNVTVVDNEKPVITTCPGAVTVSCVSEILVPDISAVSASDNCGTPTITHVGDVITNQTCANKYTLTRTYKATDGSGNTATCSQLITVDDNTPPQITGLTPSKQVLWPPNHKMVDVMLNYTVNDNCASSPDVTINISSNEPVNGTGDGDTDPDWEIIDDHHVRLRAERAANGNGRIYTITVTVDDGCNPPVSESKQVTVAHNITAPQSGKPFKVGSTVSFGGTFWDKPGNTHTSKWLVDGSAVANGIVTEPTGNQNGKVTGSYKFKNAGVYKLQMNITDQTGITSYANTNEDVDAIVVIYDPNGGYTYGGGYFNSPAGALVSNPSVTGKASFGFAINYRNATNPKGETQFEFKVGNFEFNALNFDYLVVSGVKAQFKGTGKITGGQSGIAFIMTVIDGELDGTGIDKIRMKIYNKNTNEIIYDNQPGASDADDPVTPVGANSEIFIQGSSVPPPITNNTNEIISENIQANSLEVMAYPNPSANNFSILVRTNTNEKITMQVMDMYGRVIETGNVIANSIVRLGDRYTAGTYFVRIIQGKEHEEIKLVKLN